MTTTRVQSTPGDDAHTALTFIGVEEAVQLAAGHARALGLRVDDVHVLRDGHNVLLHLRPSPVVARVALTASTPRDTHAHMCNEMRVVRFLAARGASVVPPAGTLDPGPHIEGRAVISYWTYVESAEKSIRYAPDELSPTVIRSCETPTSPRCSRRQSRLRGAERLC